ncbi:MAG: Lrp/AsnC family transcriptional regulator [Firmicutes bacterium]|nr:Lrp/AsnC family transcriptional regulator [Bacillota bacterium]
MLAIPQEEVEAELEQLREENVILGYHTLVDWEKTSREFVTAQIEVKVTPQRDFGFDQIAQRIAQFPEVQSVFLYSGDFDLSVIVEGKTIKDIAAFVSDKLAVMDSVESCKTHFILKKYKQNGFLFEGNEADERPAILL